MRCITPVGPIALSRLAYQARPGGKAFILIDTFMLIMRNPLREQAIQECVACEDRCGRVSYGQRLLPIFFCRLDL